MGVIFGINAMKGARTVQATFEAMASSTLRYGCDGSLAYTDGSLAMGVHEFRTHERSLMPSLITDPITNNTVCIDGRLDNHAVLADMLGRDPMSTSDAVLISSAFDRWGAHCLSRLIGDWAVAIWAAASRTLYLARDHAGSRSLFYQITDRQIMWSTYLDGMVRAPLSCDVDTEFLSLVLGCRGVGDRTPHAGIRAVQPGHYLAVVGDHVRSTAHWLPSTAGPLLYRTPSEYDECFKFLFEQSVRRRLSADRDVLSHLSGGVDSAAIVCVADRLSETGDRCHPRVNTLSYYDDSEPDWNERPYFQAVERQRGKIGIHIDSNLVSETFTPLSACGRHYPYLVGDGSALERAATLDTVTARAGVRVLLSGMGGDELMGGVPTPLPELANYLRHVMIRPLLKRSFAWAMSSRSTIYEQLIGAAKYTVALYRNSSAPDASVPPWLSNTATDLCRSKREGRQRSAAFFKSEPSMFANALAWEAILEALPHLQAPLSGCYEYRYPFLDRDLVEFVHRVPPNILVEPGRRRALMRRALVGVVPSEVLERRRKAFISRGPVRRLRENRARIEELFAKSEVEACGLIDSKRLLRSLDAELSGDGQWTLHLRNAIEVELWLRSLSAPARCSGGSTSLGSAS